MPNVISTHARPSLQVRNEEFDRAVESGRTIRPDGVLHIEAELIRRILNEGKHIGRDICEQQVSCALMISDAVWSLCCDPRNETYAAWLYEFILEQALDVERRPLRWYAMSSYECKRFALYHFKRCGIDDGARRSWT